MNPIEVRRIALLGAAKVAFSAALVGCGGVVVVASEGPGEGGGSTGGGGTQPVPWSTTSASTASGYVSQRSASSTSTGEAPASCGATTVGPFSEEAVACCQSLIGRTFGDPATQPVATPNLVACCDMALVIRDTAPPGAPPPDTFPWTSTYRCCQVPGVTPPAPASPTCTPWGPPAPPALPEGLGWLEEAA